MSSVPEVHSRSDDFLHELQQLVNRHALDDFLLCAVWVGPHAEDAGGTMLFGGHLIKVPGWTPDSREFEKSKVALVSAALAITSLMPAGEDRKNAEQTVLRSLRIEPVRVTRTAA